MGNQINEGQVKEAGCDITNGVEDVQARNRMLLDRISQNSEGEVKEALAAGTNMIRRRIYEEGFTRRCIPPQTVV